LIPLQDQCGTPEYFAPEIHYKVPYDGAAVDVFNCGIILFLMVFGFQPFERADPRKDKKYLCFAQKNYGPVWEYYEKLIGKVSDELKDLINGMFAYQPDDRLSLEQVKNHAWFKGEVVDEERRIKGMNEMKKTVEEEIRKEKEREKEKKKRRAMMKRKELICFMGVKKKTIS